MIKCMEIPLYDLFTENFQGGSWISATGLSFRIFCVTYFSLLKSSQDPFFLLEKKKSWIRSIFEKLRIVLHKRMTVNLVLRFYTYVFPILCCILLIVYSYLLLPDTYLYFISNKYIYCKVKVKEQIKGSNRCLYLLEYVLFAYLFSLKDL